MKSTAALVSSLTVQEKRVTKTVARGSIQSSRSSFPPKTGEIRSG